MASGVSLDVFQGPDKYEMGSFDVPDNAEIAYSCLVMRGSY